MVLELLQDMLVNNHLIAAEQKTAAAIVKQIETAEIEEKNEQLRLLLNPTQVRATHVCSSNPKLARSLQRYPMRRSNTSLSLIWPSK